MKLLTIGINHKTSPIETREKFYLPPLERQLLLSELKSDPAVAGAIVLATCNRCEVYAAVTDDADAGAIIAKLFRLKHLPITASLKKMFYVLEGGAAEEHLFKVACGLDSLILGENQVLGQIKEAIALARQSGMMEKTLNVLTNFVMETAKKARQDTQIDFGGVSVSAAAVAMAQNFLGTLEGKDVLVIGSGKMGRLALNYLRQKKARHIYIMNRTTETAAAVAEEFQAQSVPFWDLKDILSRVDVCICSAGSPHYLVTRDLVDHAVKPRETALVCIDISMPRNIDPRVGDAPGVKLISLDDLDRVIEGNIQKRRAAAAEVERLITRKMAEFHAAISKTRATEAGMRTQERNAIVLGGLTAAVLLWSIPASADLKMIKAYKEAYPEAKPKCIDCHADEKPKKEDGLHELNDYGKTVLKLATEPTVETFQKAGKIEDFKGEAK